MVERNPPDVKIKTDTVETSDIAELVQHTANIAEENASTEDFLSAGCAAIVCEEVTDEATAVSMSRL